MFYFNEASSKNITFMFKIICGIVLKSIFITKSMISLLVTRKSPIDGVVQFSFMKSFNSNIKVKHSDSMFELNYDFC